LISLKEIKNNIFKKENFFSLVIILVIFGLDRYSKTIIIKDFNETIFYVNDFLNFDLIWNTGIGFGLFSFNSTFFYNLISGIIATVIIFLIILGINSDKFDKISFSIIIGGAIGNFYDRIYFKAVPDFIDFHYENIHWFTFNLADIFITTGIIAFIIKGFLLKSKE
tara:strand:+ start:787 stop:1284 length:498 start_codon:yes stop_codon:yes gene_type:complete